MYIVCVLKMNTPTLLRLRGGKRMDVTWLEFPVLNPEDGAVMVGRLSVSVLPGNESIPRRPWEMVVGFVFQSIGLPYSEAAVPKVPSMCTAKVLSLQS